jgi:hypothetical protein
MNFCHKKVQMGKKICYRDQQQSILLRIFVDGAARITWMRLSKCHIFARAQGIQCSFFIYHWQAQKQYIHFQPISRSICHPDSLAVRPWSTLSAAVLVCVWCLPHRATDSKAAASHINEFREYINIEPRERVIIAAEWCVDLSARSPHGAAKRGGGGEKWTFLSIGRRALDASLISRVQKVSVCVAGLLRAAHSAEAPPFDAVN